ncbi:hypothetical protein COCOBI_01-7980 [Coccomyxa sp. Obi]|nr:hypothetical protein COCOBI_01-7980 [Coccomyxa sp. Obi]
MAPHTAMGRVGEAVEVAAPIVFLASSAASWITGASLLADGGMMLGGACAKLALVSDEEETPDPDGSDCPHGADAFAKMSIAA